MRILQNNEPKKNLGQNLHLGQWRKETQYIGSEWMDLMPLKGSTPDNGGDPLRQAGASAAVQKPGPHPQESKKKKVGNVCSCKRPHEKSLHARSAAQERPPPSGVVPPPPVTLILMAGVLKWPASPQPMGGVPKGAVPPKHSLGSGRQGSRGLPMCLCGGLWPGGRRSPDVNHHTARLPPSGGVQPARTPLPRNAPGFGLATEKNQRRMNRRRGRSRSNTLVTSNVSSSILKK